MSTITGTGLPGWLGAVREVRRPHRGAVTHQAASVLLGYPDERFFERLPLVARAAAELPRGTVRSSLLEFCEHAATTPEAELCRHYAEVFDVRRSCALHMSSYPDGDTGRRGHALAEVERVYTEAGWQVTTHESPDHLAVILEFAARGDAEAGHDLLLRFRPGLDLLAAALREHGTPYARVVDAVALTLPDLSAGGSGAVRGPAVPAPAVGAGQKARGEGAASSGSENRVPRPRGPGHDHRAESG